MLTTILATLEELAPLVDIARIAGGAVRAHYLGILILGTSHIPWVISKLPRLFQIPRNQRGQELTMSFKSVLETIGHDFKVGFEKIFPYIAGPGEVAVALFDPSLSPIFNKTVSAVLTAEQAAAAVGKQAGTGVQKAASVVALMGPLIAQALADAGKPSDDAAVQTYINAIVTILNTTPAPVPST
jgi:hypothetical protein